MFLDKVKSLFSLDFLWIVTVFSFFICVQFVFPELKRLFMAGYLQ